MLARWQPEVGQVCSDQTVVHAEDYMADPEGLHTWRLDPAAGPGVVADLGSHVICLARYLLGPNTEMIADIETVVKSRPVAPGSSERKPVLADRPG